MHLTNSFHDVRFLNPMHALNCQSKIYIFIESHLMYLNVFLNMTNMFSHQKIVYLDLSTAKKNLNTTGTTEKCLIVSSVPEWMCVLMYEQPCNIECCLASVVARSVSALHLLQALHTWRVFESHAD